jgi:hypothetical protein
MTTTTEPTVNKTCPAWCTAEYTAEAWDDVRKGRCGILHTAVDLTVSTPVPPDMIKSWACEGHTVEVSLVMHYDQYAGNTLPSIELYSAGQANLSAAEAERIGDALLAAANKLSQIEDAMGRPIPGGF